MKEFALEESDYSYHFFPLTFYKPFTRLPNTKRVRIFINA